MNELVEQVRDAMVSTLILTKKQLTMDDVEALATAVIPVVLEHAAKVAIAEKVDADATGEETDIAYNHACDDCAAAIRASAEPTP